LTSSQTVTDIPGRSSSNYDSITLLPWTLHTAIPVIDNQYHLLWVRSIWRSLLVHQKARHNLIRQS